MRIFFDSSAFVKRYVQEDGTDAVLSWCDQASELCLSGIALPEIISAFCRLQREKLISATEYRQLKSAFMADITDAAVGDLTPGVIRHAINALENNVLRGMDALHIGAALEFRAELFVSADVKQCTAATAAGLRVEMV
jgi:predicted nucleic acid-binding protein